MFYQKTLKRMRTDLDAERDARRLAYDKYYAEKLRADGFACDFLRQEEEIRDLKSELNRFHDINVSLAAQHRDTQSRLELLQDVLKQLQIPVKLPARKR